MTEVELYNELQNVEGLIIPQFDKKVVFYFEKVKRKD